MRPAPHRRHPRPGRRLPPHRRHRASPARMRERRPRMPHRMRLAPSAAQMARRRPAPSREGASGQGRALRQAAQRKACYSPLFFPSFRLAPCHLFSLSVSIAKPSPSAPKRRARKRYPHHIKAKSHLHPPPLQKKALRDQNRHGRHDGAGTWHVATPGRTEPREPTAHRGDQHRQRPGRAENAADWEFEASTMPGGRDRGVAAGRG